MKTRIAVTLAAYLIAGLLRANIAELSEGTQIWQLPAYQKNWISFYDEARVIPWTDRSGQIHTEKAWVSLFGALNGGTLFDTDLFVLDPTTIANLWWSFGDSGFSLSYIVVNIGQDNSKIYRLRGAEDPFAGNLSISAFRGADIQDIALFGPLPGQAAPDSGSAVLLLAVALASIPLARRNLPT